MKQEQNLFQGQVVVITGGSSGIGAAAAAAFSRCGATVYITGRSPQKLEKQIETMAQQGLKATAIPCDVRDYESMREMYRTVLLAHGGVDIVLVNAGVHLQHQPLASSDQAVWADTIQTNLIGAYYTVQPVLPSMIENRSGKILFIGSGRGRRAAANVADYSCAKAGAWMLMRCLAVELAQYGIAVNEIIPGPVRTGLNSTIDSQQDLVQDPGGEYIKKPEDITDCLLFVASQSNTQGPTGQTFAWNRREL